MLPCHKNVMNVVFALAMLIYMAVPGWAAERLCDGPAVIFCDDFETGTLHSWQDGYKTDLHAITSDPMKVFAGERALEVTYPKGGEGKWLARWFMPGYERTFARLYIKFEEGYRCGVNCTKILAFYGNRLDDPWSGFGKAGIRPTGTDFFFASLVMLNWHRRPDPGEVVFYSYFRTWRRRRTACSGEIFHSKKSRVKRFKRGVGTVWNWNWP
jgi:hypothetical protein